ncbi:MAG: protein kinase [Candidatus Margulisbacteria bacterium]|nr:protein kinase [Candidatus Margulisiibacteriota bacterium]
MSISKINARPLHSAPVRTTPRATDIKAGRIFNNRYLVVEVLTSGGMANVCRAIDLDQLRHNLTALGDPSRTSLGLNLLHQIVSGTNEEDIAKVLNSKQCKQLKKLGLMMGTEVHIKAAQGHMKDFLVRESHFMGIIPNQHASLSIEHGETDDTGYFLVQRSIDGYTLDALLYERDFDLSEAINIIRNVLVGLDAAHRQTFNGYTGFVHRDIKPANIVVDHARRVYIIDWGTVHPMQEQIDDQLIGTVSYMAPEQIRGNTRLDARTDIYALAIIFQEMVTGVKSPMRTIDVPGLLSQEKLAHIMWKKTHTEMPPLAASSIADKLKVDTVSGETASPTIEFNKLSRHIQDQINLLHSQLNRIILEATSKEMEERIGVGEMLFQLDAIDNTYRQLKAAEVQYIIPARGEQDEDLPTQVLVGANSPVDPLIDGEPTVVFRKYPEISSFYS